MEESNTEQFLRAYSGCEAQIFAYLVTLLGNWSDAEEVYQETTLALWRSFDDYQPGTNFMHWAKRVAFNRVLTFRKQKKRQGIPCSSEFFSAVEEAVAIENDLFDARARALANCLKKLTDQERQLISLRYENDCTIKDVAAKTGRPANTLYKALGRIRHALLECIERTLSREEQA